MKKFYIKNDKELKYLKEYIDSNIPKTRRNQKAYFEFSSHVSANAIDSFFSSNNDLFKNHFVLLHKNISDQHKNLFRKLLNSQKIKGNLLTDIGPYGNKASNAKNLKRRYIPHVKKTNLFNLLHEARSIYSKNIHEVEFNLTNKNIDYLFSSLMVAEEYGIKDFHLRLSELNDFTHAEKIKSQLELFKIYHKNSHHRLHLSGDSDLNLFWKNKIGSHFFGLTYLDIDVSNKCTHSCLFCGIYSPDIIKRRKDDNQGRLPKDLAQMMSKNVDMDKISSSIDFFENSLEIICLGGAGDPFLHPQIIEIIHEISSRDISVHFFTNFDYLNKEQVKTITSYASNSYESIKGFVNISAATPETFAKIRPKQNPNDFLKITEMIKYAGTQRLEQGKGIDVSLLTVLNKINLHELPLFPFLVIDLKATSFFPKSLEVHDNEMEKYALDSEELNFEYAKYSKMALYFSKLLEVRVEVSEILESQVSLYEEELANYEKNHKDFNTQINDFLNSYNIDLNSYTQVSHKKTKTKDTQFIPRWPETSQPPFFSFEPNEFESSAFNSLDIKTDQTESYPESFYKKYPCKISDFYSRILVDGEVQSCCISGYEVGNINNSSLNEIVKSSRVASFSNLTQNFPNTHKHQKEDEWSFCKQCCHLQLNKKAAVYSEFDHKQINAYSKKSLFKKFFDKN